MSLSDSRYDLNDPWNDSGDPKYGQNDIQMNALPTNKQTDQPTNRQTNKSGLQSMHTTKN